MGLLAEHYSYLAWRFRPDKLEGLWRRCKSLFPFLGVRVFFISLGYFLKCYNFPRCVSQRVFFCISERYLCMTFNVFSRFLLLFFSFSLFTFFFFLYIFLTFFFFLYIFLFPSISFLFFPWSTLLQFACIEHWQQLQLKHQLHSQSRLLHIIMMLPVQTPHIFYYYIGTCSYSDDGPTRLGTLTNIYIPTI